MKSGRKEPSKVANLFKEDVGIEYDGRGGRVSVSEGWDERVTIGLDHWP